MGKSKEELICPKCTKRICKSRSSVACTTSCKQWFHLSCTQLDAQQFNNLSRKLITWTCEFCNNKNIQNENDLSTTSGLNMTNLEDEINKLGNEPDLERSLTIAAEAGNVLLKENEALKQEMHEIKSKKDEKFLELEDMYKELGVMLKNNQVSFEKSEKNMMDEIVMLKKKLGSSEKFIEECAIEREELEKKLTNLMDMLTVEKSLHSKQLECNLLLKKDLDNLKNKLSSLLSENENLKIKVMSHDKEVSSPPQTSISDISIAGELTHQSKSDLEGLVQFYQEVLNEKENEIEIKNALISEQISSLEVMETSWKLDCQELEELRKLNKLQEKELGELRTFYQPGAVIDSKTRAVTHTKNSFSCLESKKKTLSSKDAVENKSFEHHHQHQRKRANHVGSGKHSTSQTQHASSKEISNNYINNSKSKNSPRVTIEADSHGKELVFSLTNLMGPSFNIFGRVQSGAPLEAITGAAETNSDYKFYTKDDYLIWIGGTNNISKSANFGKMKIDLEKHVKKYSHTNLIVATIPQRYDLAKHSEENMIIDDINHSFRGLSNRYQHVRILDLQLFLSRRHHTSHGLHLNKSGKKVVACLIRDIIVSDRVVTNQDSSIPAQSIHANSTTPSIQAVKSSSVKISSSSTSSCSHQIASVAPEVTSAHRRVIPGHLLYSEVTKQDHAWNTSFMSPTHGIPLLQVPHYTQVSHVAPTCLLPPQLPPSQPWMNNTSAALNSLWGSIPGHINGMECNDAGSSSYSAFVQPLANHSNVPVNQKNLIVTRTVKVS